MNEFSLPDLVSASGKRGCSPRSYGARDLDAIDGRVFGPLPPIEGPAARLRRAAAPLLVEEGDPFRAAAVAQLARPSERRGFRSDPALCALDERALGRPARLPSADDPGDAIKVQAGEGAEERLRADEARRYVHLAEPIHAPEVGRRLY